MAEGKSSDRVDDTDRQWSRWMAAAQAGDRPAYEALLRACIPLIKTVARQQGVAPDGIDDVVQETLITIHRARQTYDPSRSFVAWLRTIAQRRAIDGLRSRSRRHGMETSAPLAYENHADSAANPAEIAEQTSRTAIVSSAVATLPAGQRQAVEHLGLRGQTLTEAAAATGRSTGALKVNFHRALKTLRSRFGATD